MSGNLLTNLIFEIHQMAIAKGWWVSGRQFPEVAALIHSEISEALEEHRNGRAPTEIYFSKGGKPEGIPIELADVFIRVADYCGREGIDLMRAIELKMEFNAGRPSRHGGKVC